MELLAAASEIWNSAAVEAITITTAIGKRPGRVKYKKKTKSSTPRLYSWAILP